MVSVSFLVNCSKTENEQVLRFYHLLPIESGHRLVPSAHFAEPDSAGLCVSPPGPRFRGAPAACASSRLDGAPFAGGPRAQGPPRRTSGWALSDPPHPTGSVIQASA